MILSTNNEDMSSGNDEKEMQKAKQEAAGGKTNFRYALRKFRSHSENFAILAILAKFSLCTNFR